MIITQTPFRVSFAGGGTDLPAFYQHEPGAVLSVGVRMNKPSIALELITSPLKMLNYRTAILSRSIRFLILMLIPPE